MDIKKVIVGITGNHVVLQPCHGVVAVSSENKEITQHDVYRVREAASLLQYLLIVKLLMWYLDSLQSR